MIPTFDVDLVVALPDGEDCGYPKREEISEEGFGAFRSTWFLGHVTVDETGQAMTFERELVAALSALSPDEETFEVFASAAENCLAGDDAPDLLKGTLVASMVTGYDDVGPLGGLEVGVAGLTHALSNVGFLTAASCRAHISEHSWSDCPVVLFGAHKWRATILAEFAAEARCGIGQDRGMLTVYARSITDLMRLADLVFEHRARFRRRPDGGPRRRSAPRDDANSQPSLDLGL